MNRTTLALLVVLVVSRCAQAQETITGLELFSSQGFDPETTEIQSLELSAGIYGLAGAGGNILASIGEQGTLIVDDQFEASVPRIRARIKELGGGNIDFVINTHWHFDHADGNLPLAEGGSWIVAHESTREMMKSAQSINLVSIRTTQEAYPEAALPVITFSDRMRIHFNGHTIDLLHFGPAHTASDVAVLFREAGVVHMGDIYNGGYPLIDVENGGSLAGTIEFCEKVLAELGDEATVVPGHGRPSGKAEFAGFVEMLRTIHERLQNQIDDGATLEQAVESGAADEWIDERGDPTRLLNQGYRSITREGR